MKQLQARFACVVLFASVLAFTNVPARGIEGTYTSSSITPLQRAPGLGTEKYYSEEDALKVLADIRTEFAKGDLPSDENRAAPPTGGDGSLGGGGNVGGYNKFWLDRSHELYAEGERIRNSIVSYPADGRIPDLTRQAARRVREEIKSLYVNTGTAWWLELGEAGPYDNVEQRPLAERCIVGFGSTSGPPMLPVAYNNLKNIVVTDHHVLIFVEMIHDARIVHLNGVHPPSDMQFWMGHSVGEFQSDGSLLVETTNFKERSGLFGADAGLRVLEWFTPLESGDLRYAFEVDNLSAWQDVWRGDYVWKSTSDKPFEYACHEGNYSLGGVLRGARMLEKDYERSIE